jgi:hypothetical protein
VLLNASGPTYNSEIIEHVELNCTTLLFGGTELKDREMFKSLDRHKSFERIFCLHLQGESFPDPEDGGRKALQRVSTYLPNHTASHLRRQ